MASFDGGVANLVRAMSVTPPPAGAQAEPALIKNQLKIQRVSEFVSVRGTPTQVIKYGCFDESTKTLVLLIPGNPGVPDYYDQFMETMHLASGQSLTIWCLSHAGHVSVEGPEVGHLPPARQDDPHRKLRGQVDHKLAFIKDHVILPYQNFVSPSLSEVHNESSLHRRRRLNVEAATPLTTLIDPSHHAPPSSSSSTTSTTTDLNLVLVGHSIGCWMIIELMKKMKPALKKQVVKAFLLYPTIERMAVSPNGRFLTPLVTYIPSWFLALPFYIFQLFPVSWRQAILRFYFSGRGVIPDCIYKASLMLAQPLTAANCLELYYEESYTVVNLDIDFIQTHLSQLRFYYGTTDAWVPTSYYQEMKDVFPDGDIQLCQEGYEHAFVIKNSEDMALTVWSWIQDLDRKRKIL